MNQTRTNYLFKQYAAGLLTPAEQQELAYLIEHTDRRELEEYIAALAQQQGFSPIKGIEVTSYEIFNSIIDVDRAPYSNSNTPTLKKRIRRLSAAAVVLLSLITVVYVWSNRRKSPMSITKAVPVLPVKPEKAAGRNTAILTLGDNTVVELDSLTNGLVATEGGSRVMLANGQLAYVAAKKGNTSTVTYNTVTTPRGGEYTITLPDGTKVWLNAASSLKFPTAFTGNKRAVEMSGEAYLAVAEDKTRPFEIKVGNVNVAVHGTQFNIMGYEDEEKVVTTLVSGAVQISVPGNAPKELEPGEHAVINQSKGNLYVEKANVDEETAWKNGKTYFNGTNIKQIMRQIARWYDVEVEYKGDVSKLDFACTVSRHDKLSKLLELLEYTGTVHFSMKENTIIVEP
jgi:transmembrane sensor